MSTALLLGASGFIGSAILKKGIAEQDISSIVALEHRTPVHSEPSDKLKIIRSSIDAIDLNQYNPRYLIHAARQASSHGRLGRLYKAFGGAGANSRIIKQFRTYNHNHTDLWYISGSLMYGDGGEQMVTESFPLHPISFARDYVLAEKPFLREMLHNPHVHMVRVPWVFGEGSWFGRFYLDYMRTNHAVPLYGDGHNLMTFIDNDDLASALWYAVTHLNYPVLNLFMPDYISQEMFAHMISQYSGMPVQKIPADQLKIRFGTAVSEAFTSSIKLGSDYDISGLLSHMRFKDVAAMLSVRIPEYLAH